MKMLLLTVADLCSFAPTLTYMHSKKDCFIDFNGAILPTLPDGCVYGICYITHIMNEGNSVINQ